MYKLIENERTDFKEEMQALLELAPLPKDLIEHCIKPHFVNKFPPPISVPYLYKEYEYRGEFDIEDSEKREDFKQRIKNAMNEKDYVLLRWRNEFATESIYHNYLFGRSIRDLGYVYEMNEKCILIAKDKATLQRVFEEVKECVKSMIHEERTIIELKEAQKLKQGRKNKRQRKSTFKEFTSLSLRNQ